MRRRTRFLLATLLLAAAACRAADELWQAAPLTPEKAFTPGIEGPAVDAKGFIYAVNYERQGTIGRTSPEGKSEVYVELPEGSIGNGIRFDRSGAMYVADYTKHNVLKVDPGTRKVSVFAHEDRMSQPNDLAIGPDGALYASDPDWKAGTGRLWRIDRGGAVTRLAENMGTTNGIEVSPDGKTLYVNESVQRNIWAFDLTPDHTLANKRLLIRFPDFGFDGMRCDVDGNLYVSRHGKGTVVKVSPAGKVLREVEVLGSKPSNLCFGGKDGRTVYVTEVDHQRLVQFRVDRPGLEWQRWRHAPDPTHPRRPRRGAALALRASTGLRGGVRDRRRGHPVHAGAAARSHCIRRPVPGVGRVESYLFAAGAAG